MKLIKKLQECSTIGQADPILTRLNAGPAVKKLVETAIILSNSQDPQQRSHAYSFMESAIKELEDDDEHKEREESPMGMHGHEDGLANKTIGEEEDDEEHRHKMHEEEDERHRKMHEEEDDEEHRKIHEKHDDDEHKMHEEELSNHNQGKRTTGSEQSTDNTEPYPGEGEDTTTGEKPMQDMYGTVNQWNETGGMIVPGLPPAPNGMPPNGAPPPAAPNGGPGLDPNIAQEMGMVMPQPPPLDTNQMMRQMQYTLNDYHKRYISPLNRIVKQQKETLQKQREAIKKLSTQIQETRNASGSMKLDLDHIRENATAKFRETESTAAIPSTFSQFDHLPGVAAVQPVPNIKRHQISTARYEIEEMDRILSSKTSMYN